MKAIAPETFRTIRRIANFLIVLGLLLVFSKSAFAQEAEVVASPVDTVWVLISAALVFFMQPGFGILGAGLVRSKNVVNIMAENFMDTTMSTLAFVIAGFGILAVGIWATDGLGLLSGGGFEQLDIQALGLRLLACTLWTLPMVLIMFKLIDKTIGLRVSLEVEDEGIDLAYHGVGSYPEFASNGVDFGSATDIVMKLYSTGTD